MANLNFPTNPLVGDTHTVGSKVYTWNGYAWIVASYSVSATSVSTTGTINISNTTSSTGTNSGALVVGGGAGIGGDLYVGGNINASSTGTSITFSTGSFGTLFVTGSTSATNTLTGALIVTGGAAIGGDLYLGGLLYASGQPILTPSSFAAGIQDGVDIDITEVTTGTSTYIIVNNVSTLQSVTGRGNSTTNIVSFLNTTNSTSTDTGAITVIGGIGVGGRVTAESVRIVDAVFDSTETLVNTTATTMIDTFNLIEFRSAKYLIQIDEGTGAGADFELIEILLVADNEGNVWATEYGVVTSNGYLGVFEAEVVGGIVGLYFTATAMSNKKIRVLRTGMAA
jgi:hypothetical protein